MLPYCHNNLLLGMEYLTGSDNYLSFKLSTG
ncbi:hypothetical protein J2X71_007622 [Rhizobium sp. 1399]|nr:hypothetical protein [Rhizobium sp. 1399]